MLYSRQLDLMSQIDIEEVNPNILVDINLINIDTSLPTVERMERYLQQIKNPYCFLCRNTKVKIQFDADAIELKQKLKSYFTSLKKE